MFLKSFCTSQHPNKSINLSFTITDVKIKLKDLWGNRLWQNDFKKNCVRQARLGVSPERARPGSCRGTRRAPALQGARSGFLALPHSGSQTIVKLTSMLGVWNAFVLLRAKKRSVKCAILNQTETELGFMVPGLWLMVAA